MRFEFKPCPDCGYRSGYPMFDRDFIRSNSGDVEFSVVKAICQVCGWETGNHNNVEECADEWNNTCIYEDNSAEDDGNI